MRVGGRAFPKAGVERIAVGQWAEHEIEQPDRGDVIDAITGKRSAASRREVEQPGQNRGRPGKKTRPQADTTGQQEGQGSSQRRVFPQAKPRSCRNEPSQSRNERTVEADDGLAQVAV